MIESRAAKLVRVLCVDDEADIRTITKLALEARGGLVVTMCSSGAEALARVEEADPQLILLDVMLPGMDGRETLRRLRELPATARTPIAFLTAKLQSSEVAALMALGAIAVLPKPFNPMTLADDVGRLWAALPTPNCP